jgi:hypothetical protein
MATAEAKAHVRDAHFANKARPTETALLCTLLAGWLATHFAALLPFSLQ